MQDLSGRGLMFDGAFASLEHYCLCIAQIRQCQKILAEQPIADTERVHPAYTAQQKAIVREGAGGRAGAVRGQPGAIFQGKAADEREWDALDVG